MCWFSFRALIYVQTTEHQQPSNPPKTWAWHYCSHLGHIVDENSLSVLLICLITDYICNFLSIQLKEWSLSLCSYIQLKRLFGVSLHSTSALKHSRMRHFSMYAWSCHNLNPVRSVRCWSSPLTSTLHIMMELLWKDTL